MRPFAVLCCVALMTATALVQSAEVRVGGTVPRPFVLTAEKSKALPRVTITAKTRDQEGTYTGVPIRDLLLEAGVLMQSLRGDDLAKAVVITGADGYRIVFALAEFGEDFATRNILLADTLNGKPLPAHAAPYQVVAAGDDRPARWVRQVASIDVLSVDR
jgi:DMSO/TMAO reductase YedYZ molybdopterin-dependent catalytic subunit